MNCKKITKIVTMVIAFVMLGALQSLAVTDQVAFDSNYYAKNNGDLVASVFGSIDNGMAIHFYNHGIYEGRRPSIYFDAKYYLANNADVANAFGATNYAAAYSHFLNYGINEGRQGSAEFSAKAYLDANADIANAIGKDNYDGAYYHYSVWGKAEERELAHEPVVEEEAVEATCLTDGKTAKVVCKTCGTVLQESKEIKKSEELHAWKEDTSASKDATCKEVGAKVYVCEVPGCPASKTEVVPKKEHDYSKFVKSVDATCQKNGYALMACSMCNAATETAVMPKIDHKKVLLSTEANYYVVDETLNDKAGNRAAISVTKVTDVSKDATCTTDGEKKYACTMCGTILDTQKVNKLGHKAVEIPEKAGEAGFKYYTSKEDAVGTTISSGNDVAVSCDASNEVYVACANDGCAEKVKATLPVKHSEVDNVEIVTKKATCKAEGSKDIKCSKCGDLIKTEAIEKTSHDFSAEPTVKQKQTCITEGISEIKCKNCDEIKTEKIPATGKHVFAKADKDHPYVAPVCGSADGKTNPRNGSGYCTLCKKTLTIPAADGHVVPEEKTVSNYLAATCENAGWYECEICKEKITIPAKGHNEAVIPATCTTKGYTICLEESKATTEPDVKGYVKNVDGTYSLTEGWTSENVKVLDITPALGHKYETIKEATCTANGMKKCTVCKDEQSIPMVEHNYVVTSPATCTANSVQNCSVCGIRKEGSDMLEHEFDPAKGAVVLVKATCEEDGTVRCKNCAATSKLDAKKHDWVETKADTCTEDGHRKCSACDKEEDFNEIKGHSCTLSGEYYVCDNCGEVTPESEHGTHDNAHESNVK